ncbi:MAG: ATP-binding protein, partial [Planctomycetaceae bacterium]|nr:ATP-binding protein [Planctomycetaceae bacterium]
PFDGPRSVTPFDGPRSVTAGNTAIEAVDANDRSPPAQTPGERAPGPREGEHRPPWDRPRFPGDRRPPGPPDPQGEGRPPHRPPYHDLHGPPPPRHAGENPPWVIPMWIDDIVRRFREPGGPSSDAPGLELPEEFAELFDGPPDSRMHFLIWDRDGKVLEKSASAPDLPYPGLHFGNNELPVRLIRQREHWREIVLAGRFDTNVLVGRSLQHDVVMLHRFGGILTLAAVGVLGVGLVGGWWFTGRAIRPLAAMARTAESISVQSLSQRIDVAETDSELGQLAVVLNRTFDRLQASFERQVRFTGDASHELRTPVAVMLAQIELSLSRPRSEQDYRDAMGTCLRASQRMKSLIESLLVLARLDAGAAELVVESISLDQLINEVVELIAPLAEQRRITIAMDLLPVTVMGDRQRLSQVVTNLLTNAVRYNKEEGRIDVVLRDEADSAVVTIHDTGIGIAPEHLPHIFDRFYRVDPARSRSEGSSGLGLAICQSLVAAHHGILSATSTLGEGTTMELRLPKSSTTAVSN